MTKRKQPPIECRLRPNYTKKCSPVGTVLWSMSIRETAIS